MTLGFDISESQNPQMLFEDLSTEQRKLNLRGKKKEEKKLFMGRKWKEERVDDSQHFLEMLRNPKENEAKFAEEEGEEEEGGGRWRRKWRYCRVRFFACGVRGGLYSLDRSSRCTGPVVRF